MSFLEHWDNYNIREHHKLISINYSKITNERNNNLSHFATAHYTNNLQHQINTLNYQTLSKFYFINK